MKKRILNKVGIIIFSRFSSKRLPGKAMQMILEKPLLGHVISRAKKINKNIKVVVATSTLGSDDIIEKYALEQKIAVFRGDLENVVLRSVNCCEKFGFEDFVRVCGDRPLFPPELCRDLIDIHKSGKFDLTTNAQLKTFPYGMTAEVINTKSLKKLMKLVKLKSDKEHLTSFYYKNPNLFSIKNISCKTKNISKLNYAVDYKKDIRRISRLLRKLKKPYELVSMQDIVSKTIEMN